MVDLEQFKENAKQHGICSMLREWESARSNKQLMDVALSVNGLEYLARSISEGWGLTPDYISTQFSAFSNGRYIYEGDGYTSSFYCQYDKEIHIDTTAALIIGCNTSIYIDRPMCELYITNSNVKIYGGRAVVYSYNANISNADSAPIIVKHT